MRMGARRDSVMLPSENWEFDSFSEEQYAKIYNRLSSGSVKVDKAPDDIGGMRPEIVSLQEI